ncbi:MAG: hypothetical protein WKG06_10160 [Segetibacter sp.]
MDINDRFSYLLRQYTCGAISIPEKEELFHIINSDKFDFSLSQHILQELQDYLPEKKADLPPHISEEIIRNIFKAEKHVSAILPVAKSPSYIWRLIAAACIAGLIFSLYYFTTSIQKFNKASFNALIPDGSVIKFNSSGKVLVVVLSDGSKVTLQQQKQH